MTRQVTLLVNDQPIQMDYFVQAFTDHTVSGILESLEFTGQMKTADISIEGDAITIKVNEAVIPANPFVSKIVRNTLVGMISSLKGVNGVKTARINIKR